MQKNIIDFFCLWILDWELGDRRKKLNWNLGKWRWTNRNVNALSFLLHLLYLCIKYAIPIGKCSNFIFCRKSFQKFWPSARHEWQKGRKLAKGDYKKSKHCVRFDGAEVKIYKLTEMVNKSFEFFFSVFDWWQRRQQQQDGQQSVNRCIFQLCEFHLGH